MGKGSNTTTTSNVTTTAPDSQAAQAYRDLLSRASGVAATPYQSYTGELSAPINAQQTLGIGNINANAGFAQPYIQQAAGLATAASTPLTTQQIQQYQSPYTQDVVNATQAQFASQNAQQQQALTSNAIAQGALGGNRTGVAAANLAQAQQTAQAPVIAGLYNTSYQQGINTALSQQAAQAQGAYSLGNLGVAGQNAALTGAGAQVGAGTLQQQTQQAQDQAAYNQFLLQQAYPFQTTQWLAGIDTGVGSQLGGTTTGQASTTGPSPNSTGQWLGAGLSAASLFLSDRRAKEDIHRIGSTNDGQPIYRFRYKGDPAYHIGLIAQEVEKDHPDAVHGGFGPMKMVDLKAATDDSVKRGAGGFVPHFDTGGAAMGGTPFGGVAGYVPTIGITGGRGAPSPAGAPSGGNQANSSGGLGDPATMAKNAAGIAKSLINGFGSSPLDISAPGVGGFSPDSVGTAVPTMDVAAGLGGLYARGGGVKGYDDGGTVDGFAPASFDDRFSGATPASFDDRFAAVDAAPSAALLPFIQPDAAYLNGAAPMKGGGFDQAAPAAVTTPDVSLPPERPAEIAGVAPVATGSAATGADVPLPAERPLTGAEPIAEGRDVTPSTPTAGYAENIDRYGHAISSLESGGNYGAVGPQVPSTGDHAYGKYQIMGANIPQWTAQVLGKSMTPAQFLASPQAQDAVFRAKFGQYVDKYGPEGASRAWFAGEGGMNNPNARDVNGTTVADYGRRFMTALGGQGGTPVAGLAPTDNATLPPNATPTQYQGVAAPSAQAPAASGWGLLGKLSPEMGQALLAAGSGMLASTSPFLGTSIGQGAQAGLKTMQQFQAQQFQRNLEERKIDIQAANLQRQAQQFGMTHGLAQQQFALAQRKEQLEELRPVMVGQNAMGQPVYMQRDPATGQYKQIQLEGAQGTPSGTVPIGSPGAVTGDAYLKSIDPNLANQVKALAEGRMQFPSGFALKSPYWQHMLQAVSQYDPSFDAVQYNARARARTDATSGKLAQNNNALNTGIGHLDQLSDAVANLHNVSWSQGVNGIKNWLSEEFGGTAPTNFDAIKNRVAPEIVKIWRGTGGAESDIKRDIDSLSSSKTPAQLYGAINEIAQLMQSKIEANRAQYQQAMGSHGLPIQMITPKSQAALDKLERLKNGEPPAAAAPSAATATNSVPQRPTTVPAGSAYSPSRKMWRAPNGSMFDAQGQAVNP